MDDWFSGGERSRQLFLIPGAYLRKKLMVEVCWRLGCMVRAETYTLFILTLTWVIGSFVTCLKVAVLSKGVWKDMMFEDSLDYISPEH